MRWTLFVRVVLDTNILVSALITKGTPPDQLYQAWLRNEVELVTSTAQIDEVIDVLSRPRLRRFIEPGEAAQMVAAIHKRATVLSDVPVEKRVVLCASLDSRLLLIVMAKRVRCLPP